MGIQDRSLERSVLEVATNSKDILIELGPGLISAVGEALSIIQQFGLEAQTMPAIRPTVTIRVFSPEGQEPELVKRLKQIVGFKELVASR